jgi:PAS domain S-box-containing protein
MGRGEKPTRAKTKAAGTVPRTSPRLGISRHRLLETRLAEALEQQAATAEVLRIISASPADVQPVFDAIVQSATRLCDAAFATAFRFDGQQMTLVAHHNLTAEELQAALPLYPRPAERNSASGRAIVEGRIVHIRDVRSDPEYGLAPIQQVGGFRTVLAVPMLRDGQPIGSLSLWRRTVKPFSDSQIALMTTFAHQAVIAVENVRLFTELEARNRDLTESLEQQTATSEILRVISTSPTEVQPVFDAIVRSAVRLCDGAIGAVNTFDGELTHVAALYNYTPEAVAAVQRLYPMRPSRQQLTGRAILSRTVVHIPDVLDDPEYGSEIARAGRWRAGLAVPLLRGTEPLGVILVMRAQAGSFSQRQIDLLKTFAAQAVIAIENVRLFQELQTRNQELTGALARQTATSEILQIISRSPTTAEPVFEAIVKSASRLLGGAWAFLTNVREGALHLVAHELAGVQTEPLREWLRTYPRSLDDESQLVDVVRTGQVVNVADASGEPDTALVLAAVRAIGFRGVAMMPMLKDGQSIGALVVARPTVGAFTDVELALLKTFTDQAVIAIENVRLFKELEGRNRELIETLEQQTATSEILRVISSSPTDVQPVFDAIVESAGRLCGAESAAVYRFEGEMAHFVAAYRFAPDAIEAYRRHFPRQTRETDHLQRVVDGSVLNIPDIESNPHTSGRVRDLYRSRGVRSTVFVPMLREGQAVGAIGVSHHDRAAFSAERVELLKTFAAQAVIAIENVRLFTELEARNRDLTESLEQQTATSEILRVISSSPTEVQPVFDAIVQNARTLCGADSAGVLSYDGTLIRIESLDNSNPERANALRQAYPRPANQEHVTGRAILTGLAVHVADVREDPEYGLSTLRDTVGLRTLLSVPMIRDGIPIGAVTVQRWETPRPFSDNQIALLKTFADQAVIAIENVRLFTEVQTRNRELTEALEQQTATGEVLKVISRSTFDLGPVLDTVVENAVRLCDADRAFLFRFDGAVLRAAASYGVSPETREFVDRNPIAPGRHTVSARAVLDRRTVHVHDVQTDPEYAYATRDVDLIRTTLAVPMLKGDDLVGVIAIYKLEVKPFSDKQIAVIETFADQAVIAIENVRLFQELETKNRDLTETLEQRTATSEILRVISQSPTDVQPVFDIIAESARRLCAADVSVVSRFDGDLIHLVAAHGMAPSGIEAVRRRFPMRPDTETVTARTLRSRAVVHDQDVLADPAYAAKDAARAGGYRGCLGVPMVREGQVLGVIFVGRTNPGYFSDTQVELLKTFADQAVIAIENVRLFQELEARNRDLTQTLEQQTATSEVLRVISGSPTDVQPVFDTIARNAARLCEAQFCFVYRFDGQLLHFVAHHGVTREGAETVRRAFPAPPSRGSAAARAVLDCAVAQIPDVLADPDFALGATATTAGYRSALAVPMLRDGLPIGSIAVARAQAGLLPDRQIALLKTFAAQAVIAIENVRLFRELEARTQDLTRSVGELRALGEVSQAVSSTLDLEAVLATIVSRAVELSGSHSGIVYEFDEAGQAFHARVTHRISPEHLAVLQSAPIRLGEGAVGRAGIIREPVEVADIEAGQFVYGQVRALLAREGVRSLLAVPLVREERLLGGLVILRQQHGSFSPEVVATLQTFAAQSVLAIQNARLFREIQRQKQYSEALVETSPVAIVTMDLGGTVAGWNPGAERLFGYSQAEAIGRPMVELVATPEVHEEVQANIRRTVEGEWIRAIGRRARKDGSPVDVEISSMPVVVDGAKVGMIGIYHDITELLRARREAEAANEAKSAFLATMSHEIRTPLNAVIGMSGLLLNTPLADEQREYAEVVRQSGDALLTVINDILDFSKIEAGKLELESQPFDLRECLEGTLDLVASRAAEKGLDLAYLIADGTPPTIVGDVTRLRQVLLNLLSNAVKFTERGEVVLSVAARRVDGATPLHELTFAVRDTGIGIPADRLGRLFQSFSQLDASTTRRYGGTGLGLAISRRLSELMGGRIDVTSEVGAGSEFRLTIRAAAAEVSLPARRGLGGLEPSLRDKRVLVVDDNATNRRILIAHLDAWGMSARATGSPAEALAWVEAGEGFDVGILDMHMPEMDGVALAAAIRARPASAALPLVLFTSLGRREARAESQGFAAYLHKPIKPSQLFDALVSVLAERPVHVSDHGVGRSELDPELARRRPLRILLAEDNVVNQKVALRLLGQMGYRADVAANGLEAVAAVERQTYDVVLMDVQMPEMDGFEASREINRRWPGERRPRLVAMTANAMQGDRERCVAAGMDDYVAKPIRVDELVAALGRCHRRPEAAARTAVAVAVGLTDAPSVPPSLAPAPLAPAPLIEPVGVAPGLGPPDTAASPAIDRVVFARLTATMGRDFVVELIDTFVADGHELIATLGQALAARDVDAFRRGAHSLKSNSETLGAAGLAARARELEIMARAGSLDGAGDRLGPLGDAYEQVVRELGELRRGPA